MVDKKPRSLAKKIFLGVGYALFAIFTLLVIIGLWFGDAPETFVQAGNRLPQKFVKMAHDVGALGRGEKAVFFYSPELDPYDEFVMITEARITLYGREFEPPLSSVVYNEIADARLTRNTDFLEDSQIELELHGGDRFVFLLSSEKEGDVRVHEYLLKQVKESHAQQEDMRQKLQKATIVEKEREADHARQMKAPAEAESPQ